MFKVSSIKQLLQLWSVGTVFAIVLIAMGGIYTNSLFSETQQQLTEKVIPINGLSREISSLATVLATREKRLLVSNLLETTTTDISRRELEQQFSTHWQHLAASLDDEGAKQAAELLWQSYQQFLKVDDQLLSSIAEHQAIIATREQRVAYIEKEQSQAELAFLALAKQTQLSTENNADQRDLIAAHKALELDVLKLSNLVLKIGKKKHTNASLAATVTEVKQATRRLTTDMASLKTAPTIKPEMLASLGKIARSVQSIKIAAIESDTSLYQLQYQQLGDENELIAVQQESIKTLNRLVQDLHGLSRLINQQSLNGIVSSISVAEKTRWLLIALTLLVVLSVIKFISAMSRRVNEPLDEVRTAMHALSSSQFETRLNHSGYDDEFNLLAGDFNQFAASTQVLTQDLDDAKLSLQQQEMQQRAILNGVPEAIVTLDVDGIIQSTNPHTEHVLKTDGRNLVGQSLIRFFEPSEQVTSINFLLEKQEQSREFKGLDYNKQPFSMWLSLKPISDKEQQRFVCVLTDITDWKKTEKQLKQTSSELDTILENAMVGIAFIKDRQLVRVNQKFEEIFGYRKQQVIGKETHFLCADDEVFEELSTEVYSRLEAGNTFKGDIQFVKNGGEAFWCDLSSKAISHGQPDQGAIWIFEDITKQKENDEKLRDLASLDALTGLPNRSVFNDRLMHAIHKAQRNAKRLAIFFLDLDHFKHINDSLGHKAGDQLLCEVAKRLKSCVREGDTVARLGGDEFTLILGDIQSVQYVAKIAEKIIASVSQSYVLGSTEVNVSPSIGVSLYPADGRDVDVLVRNADAAMYHAKNSGRNNFQFYSAEMNARAAHRLAMETSIRRAVEQQDFYLHFQPQVDISSNNIIGAEVLLRWHSKTWGDVSPIEFIPILEDTGLIGIVGEQVIRQACEAYMSLQDKLDPDFKIAVNLSGRQFKGSAPLAVYVKKVLEQTGMSANNLELEITETILMEDTDLAIRTLSELSELGVTLAVDDFGTGYSSLSYLKQFPLNVLKIDKSFIDDVTEEGDDAAIVDAILAMSGHLKLEVVAEGIETLEQLKFLQQRQCARGQGYYFSRPLNFEAFDNLVENKKIAV